MASGKPVLAIYDTQTGDLDREIRITEVDEILAPAWAPDDSAIAFSGMRGGLTDLYIYDLQANRLRRLTTDVFAELQPAWSPDGRRIAFVTDRFTSDMATLSFVPYGLAVIDVESGRVDRVLADTKGKAINPQWAPDSQSLYFISDRDGVSNVYRVGVGIRRRRRRPVAGDHDRHGRERHHRAQPRPVGGVARGHAGVLRLHGRHLQHLTPCRARPADHRGNWRRMPARFGAAAAQADEVTALLENPSSGLPPPEEYPVEPYQRRAEARKRDAAHRGRRRQPLRHVARRRHRAGLQRHAPQPLAVRRRRR